MKLAYFRAVAVLVLALAIMLAFLSWRGWEGYRVETILSGSMAPALAPGSLVLVDRLAPGEYREGDIITFYSPSSDRRLVTHRIWRILPAVPRRFLTKGDANTNGDPWQIVAGNIVGKEVWSVPGLGFVLAWEKTRIGFLVLASFFLLAMVLPEIRSLRKEFAKGREGMSKHPSI